VNTTDQLVNYHVGTFVVIVGSHAMYASGHRDDNRNLTCNSNPELIKQLYAANPKDGTEPVFIPEGLYRMKFNKTLLTEQMKALNEYVNEELNADCDIIVYGDASMWIDIYRGNYTTGAGFCSLDEMIEGLEQLKE